PVGAGGGQGVEAVGDGDESGQQGDCVAFQPVGGAGAVEALVVPADGREDGGGADSRGEDAPTRCGGLGDGGQVVASWRARIGRGTGTVAVSGRWGARVRSWRCRVSSARAGASCKE